MRDNLRELCAKVRDLESVKADISALAESIQAPAGHLPSYGDPPRGGNNLTFNGREFVYYELDHGLTKRHRTSTYPLEVIRMVLYDIAWELACEKEQEHPDRERHDGRRVLFPTYLELLEKLDADWHQQQQNEIDEKLKTPPFDDIGNARFFLACKLGKAGLSYDESMEEAKRQLPDLPPRTD